MKEIEKILFKKAVTILFKGMFIFICFALVIVIAMLPVILVQHMSEKVINIFSGNKELDTTEDYRKVIDEWQAGNHTSFDYDELLTCIYVNENEDKIQALNQCASYFDGNGNFINPLISLDGSEIFGIYKNELKEWKGSVPLDLFEDIRLPKLFQKEHYKKVEKISNTTNASEVIEKDSEWILDYVEEDYYIDECEDNHPETKCILVREERWVFPYQPPFTDYKSEERYGYKVIDKDNSAALEFLSYTEGSGTGSILSFTNMKLESKENDTTTFKSERKGWEFYVEYKNANINVPLGKSVEVLQEIGYATSNIQIFTYRLIEGEKQYFNPMILMGQPTGITGGVIKYSDIDNIDVNAGLLDFLIPFDEIKVTCDFNRCYPGHTGVDVQPKHSRGLGENIRAGVGGKVILNGYDSISGNTIMIQDSVSGLFVKYNHLQSPSSYQAGDYVNRGDIIGQEGATGKVTGPHVHIQFQSSTSRSTVLDPLNVAPIIYKDLIRN